MKTACLILTLLFASQIPARAQYKTKQQKADFLFGICEKYFPMGTSILEYERKSLAFTEYVDDDTEAELLYSFGTVIHETFHGMERSFCGDPWDCNGYMLADDIRIGVKKTPVFYTPKMDKWIPDSLKEDMNSRYDPYIVGDLEITAHSYGIYGILEEMNAYYLGGEAFLSLYDYVMHDSPEWANTRNGVTMFFWGLGSNVLARHQFRFFVAWYLDYAKQFHPDVYKGIMENQSIRVVYTLLEQNYEKLEREFYQKLDRVVGTTIEGQTVSLEKGSLWFRSSGGGSATGVFTGQISRLKNALNPHWQQILEDFKLKGLTPDNWKEFIPQS